jgi:hypothetical protein
MAAIGRKDGADAQEIVQAYIETNPAMPQNHTMATGTAPVVKGMDSDSAAEPKRKD